MKRGLFLSPEGFQRTAEAYALLGQKDGRSESTLAPYIEALIEKQWSSFDDLYVSLYALNLAGEHKVQIRKLSKLPAARPAQIRTFPRAAQPEHVMGFQVSPGFDTLAAPTGVPPELVLSFTLKALMNLELPDVDPGMSFEETLLSEFDVAEVAKFRSSVERLIPYKTEVVAVGLGCIWIELGVYTTPLSEEQKKKPPAHLDPSELDSRPWVELRRRFGSEVEISPA